MDQTMLWKISYGMYAVGVKEENRICGCIINTAVQITSSPMTIAISMNKNNYTHTILEKTGRFTLSILSENTPPTDITYLGFQCGKDRDKWEDVAHQITESGLPFVSESCGYLSCEITGKYDAGTHTVFFATVAHAVKLSDAVPMTYSYYHEVIKGKAPKNAPTYQAEESSAPAPSSAPLRYRCTVCGYIHEGELPSDFVCPICHAGADKFVKIEA